MDSNIALVIIFVTLCGTILYCIKLKSEIENLNDRFNETREIHYKWIREIERNVSSKL